MMYYDHAMVGATLSVALGVQRRHGWPAVGLAAVIAMAPDWDVLTRHVSPDLYRTAHRFWGHNLFAVTLLGAALGGLAYLVEASRLGRHGRAAEPAPIGAGVWVALGVLVMW